MHIDWMQHEKAIAEAERAIALDPNDPNSYLAMASALIYSGEAKEAFDFVKKAMRLDPQYPAYYLFVLGLAQFGTEKLEDAAASFERALKRNPENYVTMIPLAAVYAQMGRQQEAKVTIAGLKKAQPMVSVVFVQNCPLWRYKNPKDKDRLLVALRKAGLN